MDLYFVVKTLHILSSTILFGAGIGIAFFMFRSFFTNNLREKHYAARSTVLADYIFTFPAVIIQPLSGVWLVWKVGYNWTDYWLVLTYVLYSIAGLSWLPVVWIQIQLKQLVKYSLDNDVPLPARYQKLFWIWFCLGWPAFTSLVVIFYVMVAKPV